MAYKPGFIENYACIYFSMLLPILQQQIYILISSVISSEKAKNVLHQSKTAACHCSGHCGGLLNFLLMAMLPAFPA